MGLAVLASSAAAAEEPGDTAPIRNIGEGGFGFPDITGPEAPENYPLRLNLSGEQELRQLNETEVGVFYSGGPLAFMLVAEKAHDADGSNVPTTLTQTGPDMVTLTVHYRDGNPAAGGAPFVYPIMGGSGWEGGFRTITFEFNEKTAPTTEPSPVPVECKVPSLRGLTRRAAAAKLRAAHCVIGAVHLSAGTGAATGRVVKQFRAAGTEFAAGASVAVKLGR